MGQNIVALRSSRKPYNNFRRERESEREILSQSVSQSVCLGKWGSTNEKASDGEKGLNLLWFFIFYNFVFSEMLAVVVVGDEKLVRKWWIFLRGKKKLEINSLEHAKTAFWGIWKKRAVDNVTTTSGAFLKRKDRKASATSRFSWAVIPECRECLNSGILNRTAKKGPVGRGALERDLRLLGQERTRLKDSYLEMTQFVIL